MAQIPSAKLVAPTSARLNDTARPVAHAEIASAHIQNIISQMLELSAGAGKSKKDSRQMVGLAAPQIGVNERIISIDTTADGAHKMQQLQVIINPQITRHSTETMLGREGCWSCGNICGIVERAKTVKLTGFDRAGEPIALSLSGFVARIAQHEVDHLNGIRFPDRIPQNHPERLHWVEPAQFEEYRSAWEHWPVLCPRETWIALKMGS